jgi:hypothetical protein
VLEDLALHALCKHRPSAGKAPNWLPYAQIQRSSGECRVMARAIVPYALASLFLLPVDAAFAEGEALMSAAADATVQEDRPDEPPSDETIHVLAAGLGRGTTVGHLVSYIRFDLRALPSSTPFESVVIKEAKLSLMATSFGLAGPGRRFLVTVRSCASINWDETTIMWRSQPCTENAESESSVIISGADLPRAYEWNVARGVARALARETGAITFTLSAVPLLDCDRDPFEGKGCQIEEVDRIGLVRFASREREIYGIGAVPHLVVNHASEPTQITRVIEVTLSVLSAFALTFGVYETVRRLFGGRRAKT